MTTAAFTRRRLVPFAVALAAMATTVGCSWRNRTVAPRASFPAGMAIAVAPVLNFTGSADLDAAQAADLLASELTDFDGIVVIPVSRVLAALAAEGRNQIESPAHALHVARTVGADAILVAGVTEYDPYTPNVGLALQLYAPDRKDPAPMISDAAVHANQPVGLENHQDSLTPLGQIQKVYNATHDDVVSDVERYARRRGADESPYGWREYLKVQTKYLRFCWHDALERMATQQAAYYGAMVHDTDMEHAE